MPRRWTTIGRRARDAAAALALASAEAKDSGAAAAAAAVRAQGNEILAANADDLAAARASGIAGALLDRLALDPKRVEAIAEGLEDIAALPDPVGRDARRLDAAERAQISRVACRSASSASSTRAART